MKMFYNDGNNKKDFELFFIGISNVFTFTLAATPPKK